VDLLFGDDPIERSPTRHACRMKMRSPHGLKTAGENRRSVLVRAIVGRLCDVNAVCRGAQQIDTTRQGAPRPIPDAAAHARPQTLPLALGLSHRGLSNPRIGFNYDAYLNVTS
jgi:hypothetical protein